MTTTVNPTKNRPATGARPARPRVRGSAHADDAADSREAHYDLLTAALLGVAIGAGTTLLLRRGPSGGRPIGPAWRLARSGASVAGRMAGRGARKAWDQGVDLWDRVPREEIEGHLRDYFETARDTIQDAVDSEVKQLRKAIRRRRRKLGL